MTNAAVAADFNEPLDVKCCFTAQVTLDLAVVVDVLTQLCYFILA
jgi:hypothetical protein